MLSRGVVASTCNISRAFHTNAVRSTWIVERERKFRLKSNYIKPDIAQEELNKLGRRTDGWNDIFRAEFIKDPKPVKVILLRNTEDYGNKGQIVTIQDARAARDDLLLPGLAVYASEENLQRYADITIPEEERVFSSPAVEAMLPHLRRQAVPVTLNMHQEWTIEPWHIKVCLSRINVSVKERCIELPKWPIKGPDMALEQRQFVVWLTVNGKERLPMRCVLHHVSENPNESVRCPGWQHRFGEPVFEEQRALLESLPRMPFGYRAEKELMLHDHKKAFIEWKKEKERRVQTEEYYDQ